MSSRRAGLLLCGCLLLVVRVGICRADNEGNTTARTVATRESSALEAKRAFAARAKQSFKKLVGQKFPKWDQNQDGALSGDEIDRLIADPAIRGLEAAAVASIHRYLRADGAPPSITQDDLLKEAERQPLLPEQGKSEEALRQDVNDGKPRFVLYYTAFASHLKTAPRNLFAGEDGPTLEGLKQGSLGDCFFMCVIGATVSRDPQTVRRMLRANSDGTTDVRFPASRTVHIQRLTDSEIALTSSAAKQGIWVNVLEKAFGELSYAKPQTHKSEDDIDLDVISRGGKIRNTIQLMTGHKAFDVAIRKYKNKKFLLPTAAEMPRLIARLDSIFSKAFATKRLVCADIAPGVKGKDIPPGLVGKHAYAVLGYDQSSQMVTVWNPHGKDFKPKTSPANRRNGYSVKGGVFEMPLDDFVHVFKAVTYETSAPLARDGNPKQVDRKR